MRFPIRCNPRERCPTVSPRDRAPTSSTASPSPELLPDASVQRSCRPSRHARVAFPCIGLIADGTCTVLPLPFPPRSRVNTLSKRLQPCRPERRCRPLHHLDGRREGPVELVGDPELFPFVPPHLVERQDVDPLDVAEP